MFDHRWICGSTGRLTDSMHLGSVTAEQYCLAGAEQMQICDWSALQPFTISTKLQQGRGR